MSVPQLEGRGGSMPVCTAARLDGLDWVRAGAAVLVVALHAGIAYLVAPMPGLAWSTQDPVGSPSVDALTWWIDGFIMPLFFVQSGFFACQLMRRKGPRDFIAHRSRRLLGPLALGCVLILPLDLYAWLLGWAADGKIPLRKLRSLKIDSPFGDNLWGVSHLWYLEYLWLFCAVAWVACLAARLLTDMTQRRNCKMQIANCKLEIANCKFQIPNLQFAIPNLQFAISSLGLMSISALALASEPRVLIGFRHSWWPLPANLLFYGPWFLLGWTARARLDSGPVSANPPAEMSTISIAGHLQSARMREGRLPFSAMCEWRIAGAIVAFAFLLPLIHHHVTMPTTGGQRAMLAGLFVLHAWLMVTGLFGASLKWLDRRPPRAIKYLAEASFWIYLFHHPVVGLTQVSLSRAPLPVAAKFVVTLSSGLTLSLLTYHVLVRRTWIGVVLNGRRLGAKLPSPPAHVLPPPVPEAARLRKSA